MFWCRIPSPLGDLTLASDGTALTGLWLPKQKYFGAGLDPGAAEAIELPVFQETHHWLEAYFSGRPLPKLPHIVLSGTDFRLRVWRLLQEIPYGKTVTYRDLADELKRRGIPASARSVGGAVGRNPISILIPCHRVIGADGRLTGYAGGLPAKEFLLKLEKSL